MKLLFTGRGTSGSWTIRGDQLGRACGAVVKPRATTSQCREADKIVVVKRVPEELRVLLRDRWWAWDILDAYPQPGCAYWSREKGIAWIHEQIEKMRPPAIIWPNRKMREDCDPGLPGIVLPHHHRPGIRSNPIREQVKVVGYEGADYLGSWRPVLEEQCLRRGWQFRMNPEHLAELDIVVAFRDRQFSGYVQRSYKSNVKLANAHGSGTPFCGQAEDGYTEQATGAEYWAETPKELSTCLDWLESQDTREQVSDRFRAKAYPLEQAAKDLLTFLEAS